MKQIDKLIDFGMKNWKQMDKLLIFSEMSILFGDKMMFLMGFCMFSLSWSTNLVEKWNKNGRFRVFYAKSR